MWNSPIELIESEIEVKMEGEVLKAVKRVGIEVNKEELLKALEYDRNQYEKGYEDGLNADKWILCSERLPSSEETWNYVEEDDVYEPNEFIVMIDGATLPTVLFYDSISNEWTDGDDEVYKVIAWQPLPEPYKKEGAA